MNSFYTPENAVKMLELLDKCETCLTHLTSSNKNDVVFHGEALFLLDDLRNFLNDPNMEN